VYVTSPCGMPLLARNKWACDYIGSAGAVTANRTPARGDRGIRSMGRMASRALATGWASRRACYTSASLRIRRGIDE